MNKIKNLKINELKIKKLTKMLLPLVLVGTLTACQQKQNNNGNNSNGITQSETEEIQNNSDEVVTDAKEKSETTVVNYFNDLKTDFSQMTDFSTEDAKNWAFDKLESTVNFDTNKEPIGDIYFKDLTGAAKGTAVGTLTYIDEKLMNLCPDYKEKAAEVFDKSKEELTKFKDSVETSIEEQIGKDKYNQIKDNIKTEFDNLKEKVKDGYTKTKEKIKDWYNDNTK